MTEGQKFDNAKPRFSLISKGSLAPVINVLEFGARKYSENNWRKVANAETRYFDAAHRHLNAWWDGQTVDPETGESHLAHAVSCLLFILALEHEKSLSRPICGTCGFAPCECKQVSYAVEGR
ncbi:dATP/dGTP diphosphohydrolase domain-containing protein [Acinetobacter baumannii]|uniref:dATP/dGTP diphosphohydrolase domain-containing protein n=1 Tax=Acinetobacter baumannii TaxID=470 RepID=UPI003A84F4EC